MVSFIGALLQKRPISFSNGYLLTISAERLLQCVAVCCNVLQCVAVCCNVLQCVAECCNVLQCV